METLEFKFDTQLLIEGQGLDENAIQDAAGLHGERQRRQAPRGTGCPFCQSFIKYAFIQTRFKKPWYNLT